MWFVYVGEKCVMGTTDAERAIDHLQTLGLSRSTAWNMVQNTFEQARRSGNIEATEHMDIKVAFNPDMN